MRKQKKSILVLTIFMAFIAIAVFLPGMTLTVETAEAVPPDGNETDENPPAPVPKTGQTESYIYDDDGDLQKGVAWPAPRLTDHGDGTVTDNLTGLMWTKNDINRYRKWWDASFDCANCSEGGYTDWRLPNVRELHSMIDYGQHSPALPSGRPSCPFGVVTGCYWSSTTDALNTSIAWVVDLTDGSIWYKLKYAEEDVWCVRGGQ